MVEKVKPNLYVLRGGGGNTAAFITNAGVVLVDTKLPGWGQPLIQKLKTITAKPVTTIVNTHAHFDHASGNVEFPPNVEIVTHENTKTYMEQWNPVYGLTMDNPSPFKAVATGAPPYEGHLRFSVAGAPTTALVKLYDATVARRAARMCDPPRLKD